MFKRSFYLLAISILLLPLPSFAAIDKALPLTDVDIKAMNIKNLTVRESTLWGLEVYRVGNYPEAVKVFQSILRKDCPNRLAQYHLQKIMNSGADFAYLKDYLAKLPCEKFNFSEEDFLPASFYMEKDTDLMLEQLEAYNKRYLDSKAELSSRIAEYKGLAEKLEQRVKEMTDRLASTQQMSTEAIAQLKDQLSLASGETKNMSERVAALQKTIAEEKTLADQKILAAENKALASAAPATVSAGTIAHTPVVATAAPTPTEELNTLQEKFANIQQRLVQIEGSITDKNQQLEGLQNDLDAVKF